MTCGSRFGESDAKELQQAAEEVENQRLLRARTLTMGDVSEAWPCDTCIIKAYFARKMQRRIHLP